MQFGCAAALIMSIVSFGLLAAVSVGPAFGDIVPSPPEADPTRPDITMVMHERFMNRVLVEALPESIPVVGEMDVQPGNRLVFEGEITVLIAKVPVVMTLGLGEERGEIRLAVESFEAAGYDLVELTGMDASAFTDQISGPMQGQIEAGLGPGAQIMSVATDDEQLIIEARWGP